MKQTLGYDWKTWFDLSFVNAQKPSFFSKPNQVCYTVDQSADNLKGQTFAKASELNKGDVLIEGNFSLVEDFFLA